MPVYHHHAGSPRDHFVLHTGTMTLVHHRGIFKGAFVRDGKTDGSLSPGSQEMKDLLLFDQLRRDTTKGWTADGSPAWFCAVFATKNGREQWVQFKYHSRSPYFTTAPMC